MKRRTVATAALLLPFWLAAAEEPTHQRLDVNTATVEQLEKLPGMNREKAETLVRVRNRNGPYRRVEELRQLRGLPKRQYERLIEFVTIGGSKEPEPDPANRNSASGR